MGVPGSESVRKRHVSSQGTESLLCVDSDCCPSVRLFMCPGTAFRSVVCSVSGTSLDTRCHHPAVCTWGRLAVARKSTCHRGHWAEHLRGPRHPGWSVAMHGEPGGGGGVVLPCDLVSNSQPSTWHCPLARGAETNLGGGCVCWQTAVGTLPRLVHWCDTNHSVSSALA